MSKTWKTKPWKFKTREELDERKNGHWIGFARYHKSTRLNHQSERRSEKQELHTLMYDDAARESAYLPERRVSWWG